MSVGKIQDICGEHRAIWVDTRGIPRFLVAVESSGESWWYMLWARGVGGSWRYGVFKYSEDPRLQSVQPRCGIVREVEGTRDVGYLLVMEEVQVRDADPEDRMLYWYVYARMLEG